MVLNFLEQNIGCSDFSRLAADTLNPQKNRLSPEINGTCFSYG